MEKTADNKISAWVILKTSIICACVFWATINAFAQQIYFNNRYDFNGDSEGATSILESDSGYIITGVGWTSLIIFKIDHNGNKVWEKIYNKSGNIFFTGEGGSLVQTIDGGYALGGSVKDSSGNADAMLFRFDKNGDTLWTRRYGSTYFEAGRYCRQTKDGGFVIAADKVVDGAGNQDFWLIQTDSVGNVEWDTTYGGSNKEYLNSIEVTQDGGFVIGGYTRSFGSGGSDTYIIKTDSAGNVEWSKTYGGVEDDCGASIVPLATGGYMVSACTGKYKQGSYTYGPLRILKIDNSGNPIIDTTYGPVVFAVGMGIHQINSNSFIGAGQINYDLNSNAIGFLFKFSINGDSLWWKEYKLFPDSITSTYFRDMKPTKDGGFVVCGFVTSTGIQDMFVLKLDSMGCEVANCTVGIEELTWGKKRAVVYPNPFHTNSTIFFPALIHPAIASVYDITGRVVKSYRLAEGESVLNIYAADIGQGIFFFQIANDEMITDVQKILIF